MSAWQNALEAVAEVFPPVPGHADQPFVGVDEAELLGEARLQGRAALDFRHGLPQGVDDGVAGHVDLRPGDAFAHQVGPGGGRGGQVQRREPADQAAVHLLGPRGLEIAGAQARLDMGDLGFRVKRGQAGGQGGGGVAVDEHPVVAAPFKDFPQAGQNVGGDVGQVLARLHDVEVEIRMDVEQLQHLVEHLPVLGGHANMGFDGLGLAQRGHHRGHFDGLGAGAEHDKNFQRDVPLIKCYCPSASLSRTERRRIASLRSSSEPLSAGQTSRGNLSWNSQCGRSAAWSASNSARASAG